MARAWIMTFAVPLAAAIVAVPGAPARAKIMCDKGFQSVAGSLISTPYCQDAYVADVARQYGFSASAERVRNDPLFKQRLCRFIGQDIRIKESCQEVNPSGRGRF
jgi:hypothetical protein